MSERFTLPLLAPFEFLIHIRFIVLATGKRKPRLASGASWWGITEMSAMGPDKVRPTSAKRSQDFSNVISFSYHMPLTVAHVVGAAVFANAKRGSASSNEGEKLTLVRRINVDIDVKAEAYDDDRPQVDLVKSFGAHGSSSLGA